MLIPNTSECYKSYIKYISTLQNYCKIGPEIQLSARAGIYGRSEGFPLAAYFVPGRDGMGVWPNSKIVRRWRRRLAPEFFPLTGVLLRSPPTTFTPYKPEMGWVAYNK